MFVNERSRLVFVITETNFPLNVLWRDKKNLLESIFRACFLASVVMCNTQLHLIILCYLISDNFETRRLSRMVRTYLNKLRFSNEQLFSGFVWNKGQ